MLTGSGRPEESWGCPVNSGRLVLRVILFHHLAHCKVGFTGGGSVQVHASLFGSFSAPLRRLFGGDVWDSQSIHRRCAGRGQALEEAPASLFRSSPVVRDLVAARLGRGPSEVVLPKEPSGACPRQGWERYPPQSQGQVVEQAQRPGPLVVRGDQIGFHYQRWCSVR